MYPGNSFLFWQRSARQDTIPASSAVVSLRLGLMTTTLKQSCCGHSQKALRRFDLSAFSLWWKRKFARSSWGPSSLSDYVKRKWETHQGHPGGRAATHEFLREFRAVYSLFSDTRAPVCCGSELPSWVRRILSAVHHSLLRGGWTGISLGLSRRSRMAQVRHPGSWVTLYTAQEDLSFLFVSTQVRWALPRRKRKVGKKTLLKAQER